MGIFIYVISIFVILILMAKNDLFEPMPLMLLGCGLWAVMSLLGIIHRRNNELIPDSLPQHFLLGLYWQFFLIGTWLAFSKYEFLWSFISLVIAFVCINFAGSMKMRNSRYQNCGNGTSFAKNRETGESRITTGYK